MTISQKRAATIPVFATRIARIPAEVRAAQRLRYEVFVAELGATGPLVDHHARIERDRFDPYADHILLLDSARATGEQVIGVTRVMTSDMAARAGQFYCADEYDLTLLQTSGKPLLELGRTCLHRDYRGGVALRYLWAALAAYVQKRQIEILFGVASFHGTDLPALAQPLSFLHHRHGAPPDVRVTAKGPTATRMDICAPDQIDRVTAVRELPALIKAYLRLGGTVAEGVFVDHAFNTVDICIILQRDAIRGMQRAIDLQGGAAGG